MPILLTLTLEALAKRVNNSNAVYWTQFAALFIPAQRRTPALPPGPPLQTTPRFPGHALTRSFKTLRIARGIGNLLPKSYIVVVKADNAIAPQHWANGCILAKAGGKCHDTQPEISSRPYGGRPPCCQRGSGYSAISAVKPGSCPNTNSAATCSDATCPSIKIRTDSGPNEDTAAPAPRPASTGASATRANPSSSG